MSDRRYNEGNASWGFLKPSASPPAEGIAPEVGAMIIVPKGTALKRRVTTEALWIDMSDGAKSHIQE